MNSFRVSRSLSPLLISSLPKGRWAEKSRDLADRNRSAACDSPLPSTKSSNASRDVARRPTLRWYGPRYSCARTSIPTGRTRPSRGRWAVLTGPCGSGAAGAGRDRRSRKRRGPAGRAFSPSAARAQVTAFACTLPRDSGRPLSRWSAPELARAVIQRGIVSSISASTVKRWLHADQIKPWQYRSWQRPTDPRFLERAIPILDLCERAHGLARKGHIIICADEKTSIQARKATGGTMPAGPGQPLHVGDRYQRRGAVQLFAGLLVHRGETLARCFERKRFGVRIHWLPVHASWLDQIEIVFGVLQKKVLTPNDFDSTRHVERRLLAFLAERNLTARPIQWSYTSKTLRARFGQRLATS